MCVEQKSYYLTTLISHIIYILYIPQLTSATLSKKYVIKHEDKDKGHIYL